MNLLDMVPSFSRQLRQYAVASDTDSDLAAYLADGIEALSYRWDRSYAITFTPPKTYVVTPDVALQDKRAIILMASIIYKMGNFSQAYFRDGDFAYDPRMINAQNNPLGLEIAELEKILPATRLAKAVTAPMRGYNNIWNRENYDFSYLTTFIMSI